MKFFEAIGRVLHALQINNYKIDKSNVIKTSFGELDVDKPIGSFTEATILEEPEYERNEIFKKTFTYRTLWNEIKNYVKYPSDNYNEFAFFNLNSEVEYDNKYIGGKIVIGIFDTNNNFHNNNINYNVPETKILIERNDIEPMQFNFSIIILLIAIRNLCLTNKELVKILEMKDTMTRMLNSMEGVTLTKKKKTKLIVYFTEVFSVTETDNFVSFLSTLFTIFYKLSFVYSKYKMNEKPLVFNIE